MKKKLVNKDPFSNGMEELAFESHNCDLCIKGSVPVEYYGGVEYTNADEDNMPKCSIQRDIVTRMCCDEPIKQETIDICRNFIEHGTPCPYRKMERPKRKQPTIKEQMELF